MEFPIIARAKEAKGTIPWDMIAAHEYQAEENHGQSLQRLAERGGLSWAEALAVLNDGKFWDYGGLQEIEAMRRVQEIQIRWEADQKLTEEERALDTIKRMNFCGLCTTGPCDTCPRKQAKEIAMAAVEKQIPKKFECLPMEKTDEQIYLAYTCKCTNCGSIWATFQKQKRCHECGQALDWSEDEQKTEKEGF